MDRIGLSINTRSETSDEELIAIAKLADEQGYHSFWAAESWGRDAFTILAMIACNTQNIGLATGIVNVFSRTPALIAQSIASLDIMSKGRAILGLGSSGKIVVEGWHGVPFDFPLGRTREYVEIIRKALSGTPVDHQGKFYQMERFRMISPPVQERLPIYLASLGPKNLALTGEVADGWLGTSFVPEGAQSSMDALAKGAARSGRMLADLDLCQGAEVAFARDEAELHEMLQRRKAGLAFSLGGMGSARTNFYNAAYARQGFADVAAESQALWLAGRRDAAASVIPDSMVMATTLLGTESQVADRLRVWEDTGITQVRLYPAGETLDERLDTLGRALDLVRGLESSRSRESK